MGKEKYVGFSMLEGNDDDKLLHRRVCLFLYY